MRSFIRRRIQRSSEETVVSVFEDCQTDGLNASSDPRKKSYRSGRDQQPRHRASEETSRSRIMGSILRIFRSSFIKDRLDENDDIAAQKARVNEGRYE